MTGFVTAPAPADGGLLVRALDDEPARGRLGALNSELPVVLADLVAQRLERDVAIDREVRVREVELGMQVRRDGAGLILPRREELQELRQQRDVGHRDYSFVETDGHRSAHGRAASSWAARRNRVASSP
jgi:hypothetical protein